MFTKYSLSIVVVITIIALIVSAYILGAFLVGCADEYMYYGVVPARIYHYQPAHILHGAADLSAGWIIEERSVVIPVYSRLLPIRIIQMLRSSI